MFIKTVQKIKVLQYRALLLVEADTESAVPRMALVTAESRFAIANLASKKSTRKFIFYVGWQLLYYILLISLQPKCPRSKDCTGRCVQERTHLPEALLKIGEVRTRSGHKHPQTYVYTSRMSFLLSNAIITLIFSNSRASYADRVMDLTQRTEVAAKDYDKKKGK